jgi:hypothetical protein
MPLLNLSLVTQTFVTLLDRYIVNSPEWNAANVLDVSPLPPDRLAGDHTLGFYLYHFTEDAAYKNPAPLADVDNPDIFQPMGLQLYYVLTAHSDLQDRNGTLAEQLMMGLAVKALRDFAFVDEATIVAGAAVFPPALVGRGNRFRVTLRPPAPEEAVQYWTAGSQPLRLAAYYQVSPVLLEPEPQNVRPGRVFLEGIRTVIGGRPRLNYSTSSLTFHVPGETTPRTVEARPAEAPIGGQVVFHGADLTGDTVDLVIRHVSWAQAEVVDPMTWGVTSTGTALFATVNAFAGAQPVLPGIYVANARVTDTAKLPDGTTRTYSSFSNQVAFAVTPRIDQPVNFIAGLVTVNGTNFDPVVLTGDQVQVFIAAERLARVVGAPAAGEFRVVDAATIVFRLPATIPPGSTVMLRIIVRGTESAPLWVTAP